jgi:hypothetical protein
MNLEFTQLNRIDGVLVFGLYPLVYPFGEVLPHVWPTCFLPSARHRR